MIFTQWNKELRPTQTTWMAGSELWKRTSFLLKLRWLSFFALQGYKAWAWRPSTFSPWWTEKYIKKIHISEEKRRERNRKPKDKAVVDPTCPNTGEGEEPVVMAAGVKAERCRSCADGTLSDGFWLADEDVGHASHPSLSDWLVAFEGQLEMDKRMCQANQQGTQMHIKTTVDEILTWY